MYSLLLLILIGFFLLKKLIPIAFMQNKAINKEQIIDKEILTEKIWGYDSEAEYNNVEVYISFLRKKIKLLDSIVKIQTVRGIGYKLEYKND